VTRTPRPVLVALLLAPALAVACAAREDSKAPPRAPYETEASPAGAPVPPPQTPPRAGEPPYAPGSAPAIAPGPEPATSPGTSSTEPPDSDRRRQVALRAARAEVELAARDLDAASSNDCSMACRALASLERATGHLCDLATEADDRRRCEDAKSKVLRARDKIKNACGVCR
jgi:hypothetical protein